MSGAQDKMRDRIVGVLREHDEVKNIGRLANALMAALTPTLSSDEVAIAITQHQLEDLRLGAVGIRRYMPEALPADAEGRIHFARALAEAAAEAIENALANAEGSL